jgi:hypothetical protein
MFIHTSITKEVISNWLQKTNPGFFWVLMHMLWSKIDSIFGSKTLFGFFTIFALITTFIIRLKTKTEVGEVFMKDIVDALIFNHEVKIGRICSLTSLKTHVDVQNGISDGDFQETKMSFWERLNAPVKPVNLIKLLSVIQESRLKDIQAKMDSNEDPFMAKPTVKKQNQVPESYNFVNDLLKIEQNLLARKK